MCRRCGEPDRRGSAKVRRVRRAWLLDPESGHGGDGEQVPCWNYRECGELVTFETMHVDRIEPGWQGGTYRRDNIRPSCVACNLSRNAGSPWQGLSQRCVTADELVS